MDEESKPDRDRYLITFEQTKYFEFHNSLDYIDGRKSLRNKFQQVCQYLFGSTSATVIKEWFPRCGGGMENVMRKIIFEEIDCLFKICQNLDSLKEDITHFFDKVDRDLSITSSEFKHRSDRRGRYGSSDSYPKRKGVPIIPKVQTGCFGDSDEEAVDLRIENRAFVVANQGNKTYVPKNIEGENVKEVQKPNIKGYFELAEKRRLLPDYDLDNFVPMDFKMDEFDPVFTT
uniref:Uncharacterized protein n=1 Tax=Panagrolaimus superbus TaxID=310955 RepID=A0A914YYD2_9BILA